MPVLHDQRTHHLGAPVCPNQDRHSWRPASPCGLSLWSHGLRQLHHPGLWIVDTKHFSGKLLKSLSWWWASTSRQVRHYRVKQMLPSLPSCWPSSKTPPRQSSQHCPPSEIPFWNPGSRPQCPLRQCHRLCNHAQRPRRQTGRFAGDLMPC